MTSIQPVRDYKNKFCSLDPVLINEVRSLAVLGMFLHRKMALSGDGNSTNLKEFLNILGNKVLKKSTLYIIKLI